MTEERDVRGLLGPLPQDRQPRPDFARALRTELTAAVAAQPVDRLPATVPVSNEPRRPARPLRVTLLAAAVALVLAIGLASVFDDGGSARRVATLPPSAAARATSACDAFRARAFGDISEPDLLGAGAATTVARPDAARIYSNFARTLDALSEDLHAVRADRLGARRELEAVRGLAQQVATWIRADRRDRATPVAHQIEPALVALDRVLIRSGIGACR